jgi:hypothetical protein
MHRIVSFIDRKASAPMDSSDLSGVVTYLHILAAFAVILHFLLEDVPIPADVIREMVMQTIEDSDLPPLTGKRQRVQSQEQCNPPILLKEILSGSKRFVGRVRKQSTHTLSFFVL